MGQSYQVPVQSYLVVAAIYILINGSLSQLATRVQRRQQRTAVGGSVAPVAGGTVETTAALATR